jgi:gliding motility-associated-like protein
MSNYIYTHITCINKYFSKYISLILLFNFINKYSNAQQFNNWFFPDFNGITFNINPPTNLAGGQISQTASAGYTAACISDRNGSLLFYSDGEKVWNKNNVLMPNGFGLFGYEGSINTALIVPFISDTSKYFLFTANGLALYNQGSQSTLPYCYSIIDMQLNGGLGDVVSKNNVIRYFSTEKMVAVPNANGSDIWWVCRDWTNNFYSYKISCNGFQNNNPVISTIGNNVNNDANLLRGGDIKASSDGKFICVGYGTYFEIYKFNAVTGVLTNPILIPFNNSTRNGCYGVEFSPNSKLLYITGVGILNNFGYGIIGQYNLVNYDSTQISNSFYNLTENYSYGGLQLGPDNKIYHIDGGKSVDAIANPDIQGVGCDFQDSVIILPNDAARRFPYAAPFTFINQNTQISYTVGPDCRTVTLTGKTYIKGNNLSFKWSFGNPLVAGTAADSLVQIIPSMGDTTFATTTYIYPPGTDTFNVSLTITSDTVCGTGRAGKKVIVKPPPPVANFGFSNTCNNLSVTFTDSSLLNFNPSLTYVYAFKPALAPPTAYSNFSTSPNNNYMFNSFDSFDVRLIVTSSLSCVQKDTIVKRIVLKAKPTAACSYTNNCGSLSVAVTNGSSIAAGSISSYKYFVGNTLISSTPNFSYSFTAFGSYTIKQVLQSNVGCVSDTFYLPVVVKDKPITTLNFANDSVCANTNFIITSNAGVNAATVSNYFWQINGGAVQSLATNTRTENLPTGIYNYKHWVRSSQGCESDTVYPTFTVVSKPTASISATNVCGSKLVNFTVNNNVVNDVLGSFYINYGNGVSVTNGSSPANYTYPNFGSYDIKYLVKSSIGCANDTAFTSIMVKDKPVISSIGYNNNACENKNFTLTSNSTVTDASISNYYWQINGGAINDIATNTRMENLPAGNYDITHWVKSSKGCESDTVYKSITVDAYPQTNFTVQNTCVNKPVVFANNSTGNIALHTWELTPADVRTGTTPAYTPTYSYTGAGSFSIKLKTATPNGCADSITKPISIETIPTAAFSVTEACLGKIVLVQNNSTNTSGAITNYSWQSSSQSSNAMVPNFIYNTVGDYNIGLNISTANGCTATTSQKVNIRAVQLFATADTSIAINQPLQLNISGAQNYTWLPTTNLNNAALPNPIFTTAQEGIYLLTSTGTTAQGCKGNEAVKITVYKTNTYLLLPNAFTPNADGLNDYFKPLCAGLKELTNFTIFNRYGQAVFNQKGCGTSRGWDGRLKAVLQNTGAFVYVWNGVDFRGMVVGGKGTVMLVR